MTPAHSPRVCASNLIFSLVYVRKLQVRKRTMARNTSGNHLSFHSMHNKLEWRSILQLSLMSQQRKGFVLFSVMKGAVKRHFYLIWAWGFTLCECVSVCSCFTLLLHTPTPPRTQTKRSNNMINTWNSSRICMLLHGRKESRCSGGGLKTQADVRDL